MKPALPPPRPSLLSAWVLAAFAAVPVPGAGSAPAAPAAQPAPAAQAAPASQAAPAPQTAQAGQGIGAFLRSAREDAVLAARRGGHGPASGSYTGLPWLRDMEFRYRKDGLDPDDMRYTLRLDPRGFGETRAAGEYNQAELKRSRLRDHLLLNRALLDRYLLAVDAMMMASIHRMNGELIQVLEDKIRVLESRKGTEDFEFTDLIEAEADLTKLRSQDMDMEQKLGALELQAAAYLAPGTMPGGAAAAEGIAGFDTAGLVAVDSIVSEVEKGAYRLDTAHVYLEYLKQSLALAESRYRMEKAEGRRYLSYLSFSYDNGESKDERERRDEGKDYDLSRAYIFEVGFRLPFLTDGRQDLNRRKEDLLTEREDYAGSRAELEGIMRKDLRDISSLVVQHRYLRERESKVDAQSSLKKYLQMAGVDPLALLDIKAANLKNRIKMEEVRFGIILNWIKVLDAAGQLSREPLRNYLAAGAPELGR